MEANLLHRYETILVLIIHLIKSLWNRRWHWFKLTHCNSLSITASSCGSYMEIKRERGGEANESQTEQNAIRERSGEMGKVRLGCPFFCLFLFCTKCNAKYLRVMKNVYFIFLGIPRDGFPFLCKARGWLVHKAAKTIKIEAAISVLHLRSQCFPWRCCTASHSVSSCWGPQPP